MLAGTRNHLDRLLFRLGDREDSIRRQLQRCTKLHMISMAEVVQGDQIARADLITRSDFTQRLPFTHPVTPRPGCCGLAGNLQATADFHVIGVPDAVKPHQRIH